MANVLIRGGVVYSPEPLGIRDILIIGGSVVAIEESINKKQLGLFCKTLKTIDARGFAVLPGLVDQHIHFNGAGGEGGPQFRTPPLPLSSFVRSGITSAVGLLGTDGITRSLMELLAKAKGLEKEGISTWIFSGSYMVPCVTLTGNIISDLLLIDKVIGLKIAVSDHRSTHADIHSLRSYISQCYHGAILSGKKGIVMIHVGSESTGFLPFLDAIMDTDIPVTQLAPTHCNRSNKVLEESVKFGLSGGFVDVTTSFMYGLNNNVAVNPSEAVKVLLEEGVPLERITLSTDGNGSMPVFNESMKLVDIGIGSPESLWDTVTNLITEEELPIEMAIRLCTKNPALHLGLKGKGFLRYGSSGDAIVVSPETFEIKDVISNGQVMMEDGEVKKFGLFENLTFSKRNNDLEA